MTDYTDTTATQQQQDIRAVLESWRQAAVARDIPRVVSHYMPDIVAFDAVQQLQFKGADAYGKHWTACMEMCPAVGETVFDMDQLTIVADERVAYAHYLIHCGHREDDGNEKTCWMRVSVGLRRTGQGWKIAHEHFSSPFDMESGKALFEAKP